MTRGQPGSVLSEVWRGESGMAPGNRAVDDAELLWPRLP